MYARKARLGFRRRRKTRDRLAFGVVRVEDGQKLCDGQQIGDALRQVEQLQAAALPTHRCERANDLAESRAVDIRNLCEIQDNLFPALIKEAVDLLLEDFV